MRFIKTIILIVAALNLFAVTSTAAESPFMLLKDYRFIAEDTEITYTQPVYMFQNHIYVPLRETCENLGIPIEWNGDSKTVGFNVYHKELNVSDKTERKAEGVIPDKETALAIGKIILEKYAGRTMEYETDDKIYYLVATYFENINAWYINQMYEYKDGTVWAGAGYYSPSVLLNKNTGEVMNLNSYSSFEN